MGHLKMKSTERYEIYLNGNLTEVVALRGVAFLKYESACLLGAGALFRVVDNDDPVLSGRFKYNPEYGGWDYKGPTGPPCPPKNQRCPYRRRPNMVIEIDRGYTAQAFSNASFKAHAAKLYKNLVFIQKCGGREVPATPANLMKELRKGREVHLFPPNSKSLNPMFVFKLVEQPKLL